MEVSLKGSDIVITRSGEVVGHVRYLPAKGRLPKRYVGTWLDGRQTPTCYSPQEALMHFYLHLYAPTLDIGPIE